MEVCNPVIIIDSMVSSRTDDQIDGPITNKPISENKNTVEMHGCIVCARIFFILAVYTPDDRLVDCSVTSPGGHCVPDEHRPLVACDTHTTAQIETAYKRWKYRNDNKVDDEQEDE
jgi:hypothetical protein